MPSNKTCKRCGNPTKDDRRLRISTGNVYGYIDIEEDLCEPCSIAFVTRTREWLGMPEGKKRKY